MGCGCGKNKTSALRATQPPRVAAGSTPPANTRGGRRGRTVFDVVPAGADPEVETYVVLHEARQRAKQLGDGAAVRRRELAR
jgi:hypothetical protein